MRLAWVIVAVTERRRHGVHFLLIPLPLPAPVSVMDVNSFRLTDVLCSAFLFLYTLTNPPAETRDPHLLHADIGSHRCPDLRLSCKMGGGGASEA